MPNVKICKFTALSSGSFCQIYRVTDKALIAETSVWPNFFLMNVFFALKGSKLIIFIHYGPDFFTIRTRTTVVDWPIWVQLVILFSFRFLLAHFGHKLTVWAYSYPWSGNRLRPSVCPTVKHFKELLLQNRLAYQSQILCVGEQTLFPAFGSNGQNGCHAYISSGKIPSEIFCVWTKEPISTKLLT